MPGCSVAREVRGCTAHYSMSGRFDGACAWELATRLSREPLAEAVLDFSRVGDFVDYAIAIVANGLLSAGDRRVELRGLRQHQERLFKCFGVDAAGTGRRSAAPAPGRALPGPALTREVG